MNMAEGEKIIGMHKSELVELLRQALAEIPTTLPANGGNADTVDDKHASDFAASSNPQIIGALQLISSTSSNSISAMYTANDDFVIRSTSPDFSKVTDLILRTNGAYLTVSQSDGTGKVVDLTNISPEIKTIDLGFGTTSDNVISLGNGLYMVSFDASQFLSDIISIYFMGPMIYAPNILAVYPEVGYFIKVITNLEMSSISPIAFQFRIRFV